MAGKKGVKLRIGPSRWGTPKVESPYEAEMICDEKKPRSLPFSHWNWGTYMRSGPSAFFFWICVTLAAIVIFAADPSTIQKTINNINYERRLESKSPERITFKRVHGQAKHISLGQKLNFISTAAFGDPDYGHIEFESIPSADQGPLFEQFRSQFLHDIDDPELSAFYGPYEDREYGQLISLDSQK